RHGIEVGPADRRHAQRDRRPSPACVQARRAESGARRRVVFRRRGKGRGLTNMVFVFWMSWVVAAYVWVGYPLVLAVWVRLRPRPLARSGSAGGRPGVSIVVAVRN